MTLAELVGADRRHGQGWVAYLVNATQVLLILDDSDDDSASDAFADLAKWMDPADWVLAQSGWFSDGTSYYVYEWEPAESRVGNDFPKLLTLP